MALLVTALEIFLGAVFCGVHSLLKAALCAVKGAGLLVLSPFVPLVFLGFACHAASRGRRVQEILEEVKAQTEAMERRRALEQYQQLLSAAIKGFPPSVETETDSFTEPRHDAEILRERSPRQRNRRRTA